MWSNFGFDEGKEWDCLAAALSFAKTLFLSLILLRRQFFCHTRPQAGVQSAAEQSSALGTA